VHCRLDKRDNESRTKEFETDRGKAFTMATRDCRDFRGSSARVFSIALRIDLARSATST